MKDYTIKAYTIVDGVTVHIVPYIQESHPVWIGILSKLRDTFLGLKIDRTGDAAIEAKTLDLIDAEITHEVPCG